MKLNLEPARKVIESLMTDRIQISRDEQRTADDLWDDTTGTYTRPANDYDLLYDGPAFVWSMRGSSGSEHAGGDTVLQRFGVAIPRDAVYDPQPNDTIEVLESTRDPLLLGQVLKLNVFQVSTFSVYRSIEAHRRLDILINTVEPVIQTTTVYPGEDVYPAEDLYPEAESVIPATAVYPGEDMYPAEDLTPEA